MKVEQQKFTWRRWFTFAVTCFIAVLLYLLVHAMVFAAPAWQHVATVAILILPFIYLADVYLRQPGKEYKDFLDHVKEVTTAAGTAAAHAADVIEEIKK